jgi:hypothetical protein
LQLGLSRLNFSGVQLLTDLEDQSAWRNGGGGGETICIMFVGSLMKNFQLVRVRTSTHEPTFLRSELGKEHEFLLALCDAKYTINFVRTIWPF